MGVKGACPLGLPPPLGERGGHPRNFHANSKNARGLLQSPFFKSFFRHATSACTAIPWEFFPVP